MDTVQLAILIGIIVLALVALKIIAGTVRIFVSLGLIFLAIGIMLSIYTGQDLFGVGPAVGYVVHTVNETVRTVPLPLP